MGSIRPGPKEGVGMIEGAEAGSIREKDSGLARLEAFSDGVFAIAITLLVLEIHPPTVEHGLGQVLLNQWPMYVAYIGSFIIIGIWWANHHELFEHFAASDHLLMLLNTLHLMCICFLPFGTALVAGSLPSISTDNQPLKPPSRRIFAIRL